MGEYIKRPSTETLGRREKRNLSDRKTEKSDASASKLDQQKSEIGEAETGTCSESIDSQACKKQILDSPLETQAKAEDQAKPEEMFQKIIMPSRDIAYPSNFPFGLENSRKNESSPCSNEHENSNTRPTTALTLQEKDTQQTENDLQQPSEQQFSNTSEKKKLMNSTGQNFRVTTIKEPKSANSSNKIAVTFDRGAKQRKNFSKTQVISTTNKSEQPERAEQPDCPEKKTPGSGQGNGLDSPQKTKIATSGFSNAIGQGNSRVTNLREIANLRDKSSVSPLRKDGPNPQANTSTTPVKPVVKKNDAGKQKPKPQKEKSNVKYFVFNSQDDHIKRALKRYGWTETHGNTTSAHFRWVYTDQELDYKLLQEGQYYNHIQNNKEMTTKNGLMNSFRNHQQYGLDHEQFFPRCYDLGSTSQFQEFKLDFERVALTILIRKLWKYAKSRIDLVTKIKIKKKFEQSQLKDPDNPRNKKVKNFLRNLVLTEETTNPNFVMHSALLEYAILSAKDMIRQHSGVMEDVYSYSLSKLPKKLKEELIYYSRLDPPYKNLTSTDFVINLIFIISNSLILILRKCWAVLNTSGRLRMKRRWANYIN